MSKYPTESDLRCARELARERGLPEADYAQTYAAGYDMGYQESDAAAQRLLFGERRRFVTESVAALAAQTEAMLTVTDDPAAVQLIQKVSAAAVRAIRDVGCICPQINNGTLNDPSRTHRGLHHLCGVHGSGPR